MDFQLLASRRTRHVVAITRFGGFRVAQLDEKTIGFLGGLLAP